MVSMALFFVSLFLTAYSARNPGLAAAGSALVAEGLRPLQSLLRAGSSTASELWNGYLALIDTEKENLFLKERLAALEVENSRLGEWEGEITRLREMVNVSQERGFQGLAADVIGYDSTNWVRAITVSRGSEDGVRIGMPVIQGNAVVGQVIAAGPRSARVLLITDHSSGIDGLVQSSRVRGTVEGSGSGDCQLNYVLSDEDVSVGDRVITSGMDGIYPKGLLIG
ncbi:MAG: rod shape-determining protein MreC, partial [Proteobacteria bacterium]